MVYVDYTYIIQYVHRLLAEKNWPTVGGEVLPLLVLPELSGFATGKHMRRDENGNYIAGGIGEVNGKMHFYTPGGQLVPYRFIHDYLDEVDRSGNAKI